MNSRTFRNRSYLVLFFLLICRILAMCVMPLNDTTEARYGEIARIMLESGNWVTPMQTIGVPFWAKPPLSTWLSASSMMIFGVNEFAARLPSLLLSIVILYMVWSLAKKRNGTQAAFISTLVLAGSLFFFLDAGVVMTDPALLFCTTLSLIAFWRAITYQHKTWGYLFFVGLGLGLLAKGPIALVLTGMPIFVWVLRYNRWRALWQHLPMLKGGLLMLLIAMPWYVLAEMKTPGFLDYFIIGEHFHRFVDPGWGGDKYGFAHKAHYGMIWLYAFVGFIPWSIVGCVGLVRHVKSMPALCCDEEGWVSYLLFCILMPLVFFTFSSNIIYPYMFPTLPFLALLFSELSTRLQLSQQTLSRFVYLAGFSGIAFLIVTVLFIYKPQWVAKSQNRVVAAYKHQALSSGSKLIYWAPKVDFSAQFYSKGSAVATLDMPELCELLSNEATRYVVIRSDDTGIAAHALQQHLIKVAVIPMLKNDLILLRAQAFKCGR